MELYFQPYQDGMRGGTANSKFYVGLTMTSNLWYLADGTPVGSLRPSNSSPYSHWQADYIYRAGSSNCGATTNTEQYYQVRAGWGCC